MKARVRSTGATGAGNEAEDPRTRPSQAAVSLRPLYPASGSSAGPGRALPTLDASEGKFVPLVLKKCQVNSEPERETEAVPRGENQTDSSRRGEGRWALRPEFGRFIGGRGGQRLGLLLKLFLFPKKESRIRDFGRRSPSPGKFSWLPFPGQV